MIGRTLWILDYTQDKMGHLVPLYAADEKDAHEKAARWAIEHDILVGEARVTHFPHGFIIHRTALPGMLEDTINEGTRKPSSL